MDVKFLDHLRQIGGRFAGDELVDFGDKAAELAAAQGGTVLVPLTHCGMLQIQGPDATEFLHNPLTGDLRNLAPSMAQHNVLCSAKGRLLASFLLWRDGEAIKLRLSRDLVGMVQKKLGMYVLRSKVKLSDVSASAVLIGLAGNDAESALEAAVGKIPVEILGVAEFPGGQVIRRSLDRFEISADAKAAPTVWEALAVNAKAAGSDTWRSLEIADGVPLITSQLQELFVPQMVNFELLGGVSFQKGCYPGQEIVARTQYLGRLKRRLYRAHVTADEAPVEAAALYSSDRSEQACGAVLNVAPASHGGYDLLAVIQIASAETGDVHLVGPDGPRLEFQALPYATS